MTRVDAPDRLLPVPRRRVLAATMVAAAVLAGMVALTESLRHPLPGGEPTVPELAAPGADPRTEVVCDGPLPREGQQRAGLAENDPGVDEVLDVISNQLYDCPQTWDGRLVRYRGEVVGAVLQREGGAWVHLNDDVYGDALGPLPSHRDFRGGNAGVGVFIPAELVGVITHVGGPEIEGDVVEVVGRFHRVDSRSAEVAVIRADSGSVVATGQPFADPVLPDRRLAALLLTPLALAIVVGERVHARRR